MTDNEILAGELARDLRALADYLEVRPTIAAHCRYTFGWLNAFCNAETWPIALREAGTFEKVSDDLFLEAVIRFGGHVKLKLNVSKESTCERVQTGEREVEREVYPDDVKPTTVTETEPVYEWVCPDSWLSS